MPDQEVLPMDKSRREVLVAFLKRINLEEPPSDEMLTLVNQALTHISSGHQQHHRLNQLTPQLVPSIRTAGSLSGLPFEAAAAASGRHRPHRRGQL